MDQLRAIIVDDEESARDVLDNLIQRFCPNVQILGKCENVVKAVEMIREKKPDLVFIDIEMPNYAGYEIVNFFDEVSFEIIFVTAYDHYALRAFEIAAMDYLLKPIDIERLKLAIERVRQKKNTEMQAQRLSVLSKTLETKELKKIVVSDKGQQYILPLENLIAIEAQESYCILHTEERKYTVSKNLKHFETLLEEQKHFFRVHKSWLVHLPHIRNYSRSDLSIQLSNGLITKLSKYKKAEFEAVLSS